MREHAMKKRDNGKKRERAKTGQISARNRHKRKVQFVLLYASGISFLLVNLLADFYVLRSFWRSIAYLLVMVFVSVVSYSYWKDSFR